MLLNAKSFRPAWPLVSVTFAILALFSLPMHGQSAPAASPLTGSVVDDWSHHRQVFSNPGSEQEAIGNGTYSRWWRIVNEPRYAMQQAKRSLGSKTLDESSVHAVRPIASKGITGNSGALRFGRQGPEPGRSFPGEPERLNIGEDLSKDWNVTGLAGGQVQPNMYPAKFSFGTTTASCASDYVSYPTGVAGTGTTANIVAYNNLYVGTGGCQTSTPTVFWAYNTGGTVTNSSVIANDATGSQVAYVQVVGTTASLVLLKWAKTPATITTATGSVSSSSTSITATTNITAADVGMQITDTSRACIPANDTIAAFSGTTVTLATATTAGCGTHAGDALTLTTEALATPGAPPLAASAAAYRSCTAPCYFTVSLGANDTYSAPYYDYTDDAMYVGDDAGKLHKITGVFNGTTIAEAASWPVTLNASFMTTSPVYDTISGYVFAGNTGGVLYAVGTGNGGTTDHTVHGTSSALGTGVIDAPIVDSTSEKVYAFVGSTGAVHSLSTCSVSNASATINCTSGTFSAADVGATINSTNTTLAADTISAFTSSTVATLSATNFSGAISGASITLLDTGSDAVYQFAANFTSGAGTQETLGTGGGDHYLYDGAFDNVYYSSANGTAGDLWVVGNTFGGTGNFGANLYRVPISGTGTMGTPVAMLTNLTDNITGHQGWPSPLTEYCKQTSVATACSASAGATTNGTDYIYFSVDRLATVTGGCGIASGNGCILGYSINTPTNTPTNVGASQFTTLGTPGCWTTGGIVIDNSVPAGTQVGASQLYFMALNGNSAGGPTSGTGTSGSCGTFSTANTPSFLQESQTAP